MTYFIETKIENLIKNKKKVLINLGYKIDTNEDFDNIVNGFINIGNSMLNQEKNNRYNFKMNKIINLILKNSNFLINQTMENKIEINKLYENCNNRENFIKKIVEKKLINKKYNKLIDQIKKNNNSQITKNNIKEIKRYILNNEKILDAFNKGILNFEEEKFITTI